MSEREFWLSFRRALLMMAALIEKRYGKQEPEEALKVV